MSEAAATTHRRSPISPAWILVALALAAIAAWPLVVRRDADQARANSLPTAAPVTADYRYREKLIAFWQRATDEHHPNDYISPNSLSQQYLQRYRERGDIDDVLRAQAAAERAYKVSPVAISSLYNLASVDLTLHKFYPALRLIHRAEALAPDLPNLAASDASLELEVGDYARAQAVLAKLRRTSPNPHAGDVIQARYDEETGHLAEARDLLERATAYANSDADASAQSRAWYYFREGQLAFEAGDVNGAIADERQALAVFPNYGEATRFAAKFECGAKMWQACLADAQASANVTPYPETLGYEADALRALGRSGEAKAVDDLIVTVDKIGNTQRVSDRLLAIYWSEHGMHRDEAYRIALRELASRDDIYTDDTLAWAAAVDGKWDVARTRMARAIRFDTEDAQLQYHAGMIALHFGDKAEAKRRLERALALNPDFMAADADTARRTLSSL